MDSSARSPGSPCSVPATPWIGVTLRAAPKNRRERGAAAGAQRECSPFDGVR
jgi:hypothetical protein